MNYCNLRKIDTANGPGVRCSLFVSGCEHRCKGCFSQETWDFGFGKPFTDDVLSELLEACAPEYISGLSVLGGDPMHPRNRADVMRVVESFRERFGKTKTVWIWTGYTYEALKSENDAVVDSILKISDVLVDGPFVESLKDVSLKFRGSSNQRVIELTKS